MAQFAVRAATAGDARAMAELFAAIAGERAGIATEPPVDVAERAAQFAATVAGSVVAVPGGQVVGMLHVEATRHGFVKSGCASTATERPGELLGLVPGDAPSATWTLDCTTSADGTDITGPYIQGPPGGRFIYLSWGIVGGDGTFEMFRRAKLWPTVIAPEVIAAAGAGGVLIARLGLTDPKGNPTCASVRPPLIEWSAVPAGAVPARG